MQLKDFDTLESARLYETTQPRMIHRDTMNSLLASAGLYVAFQELAKDSSNPFQNLIAAFLDSVEYNFMIGDPTGDRQIASMDSMIASGGDIGSSLSVLRPVIIGKANPVVRPYENATQHDFEIVKGIINRTAVTQQDGILTIVTSADCEEHNPQVYQYIASADFYKRVAGFRGVGVAGKYQIEVPKLSNLFIDDAYSVVTQPSA